MSTKEKRKEREIEICLTFYLLEKWQHNIVGCKCNLVYKIRDIHIYNIQCIT